MVTKISKGGKGSCIGLVQYLEKEDRGHWFTHNKENLEASGVTPSIDRNVRNLSQQDEKYYQVILSPSQSEQRHMGLDQNQLQAFTREAMQAYAAQFGKGIQSQDLVWFAKIEQQRTYSHTDKAVQQQHKTDGHAKEGPQMHVHIIVSRTENLNRYQAQKQAGTIDRKNPLKLSPATNHRTTHLGAVRGGFDRSAFKQAVEQQFDRQFSYERPLTETFQYANTLQKGSQEERIALRLEALRQEPSYSLAQPAKQATPQVKQPPTHQTSKDDLSL